MKVLKKSNFIGMVIVLGIITLFCTSKIFAAEQTKTKVMTNLVVNEKTSSKLLYVLSAKSGSFKGNTLTLEGVKLVIYFSDQPGRTTGQVSPKKFATIWSKGVKSVKDFAPNAVLSISSGDENKNVIVELNSQMLKGGTLVYQVRVLKGSLPKTFGPSSLFIDAFPTAVND